MAERHFLGDLTAAVREAEAAAAEERQGEPVRSFKLFDETFRLASLMDSAALLLHAKAATDGVDSASMEGIAANARFIDGCFDADEAARFWACLHANRITGAGYEVIVAALMEAMFGNPTKLSSDSADTPKETSPASKDSSSRKARSKPTIVDSSAA